MNIRSIKAPNPGPFTLDGTRTYLLGGSAIIDPGPLIDTHIEAILAAQPQLDLILITHRHADHAPAAIPLRKATGARIVAPAGVLDCEFESVSGGETLTIDGTKVEVLATPGHTSEHVCFLTADGDLFTGDTVLGEGTTGVFPPDGNMTDYIESLRLLRSRSPRRIYPAHGRTRDDANALLDRYIAHRLERERQIVTALSAGPAGLSALRRDIYPILDERLEETAEMQIAAHLRKLEDEGRVVQQSDGAFAVTDRLET